MRFFLPHTDTRKHIKQATRLWAFATVAALSVLAISCVSVPKEVALAGLFDHFEKTPHVLVRAGNAFLRDTAASLNDATLEAIVSAASAQKNHDQRPIDRGRLDKTLMRADAVAIGITWDTAQVPAIEAVFTGNFPSLLTTLSFSLDDNWQRIKGGYVAQNGKLYLRDPSGGQLHFTTWTPEYPSSLSSAAAAMARQSGMLGSTADLSMYLDAKSALVTRLPILDGVTLPFDGIMLNAARDKASSQAGSPDARYTLVFQIQMKDEQSARTYKPIVKFMWVLISSRLSAMDVPISPDNSIEQQGSRFVSQPIAMSAEQIVNTILSLSRPDGNTVGLMSP